MNINQSSSVASTVDEVVKLCRACVDEFALNKRSALAVIQGNDDFNSSALREEIANYCITAGIPVYTLDDSVTGHDIAEKIDAASHGVVIKELKDRGVAIHAINKHHLETKKMTVSFLHDSSPEEESKKTRTTAVYTF